MYRVRSSLAPFRFGFFENFRQAIETFFPEPPIAVEPIGHRPQRLRPQSTDAPLRIDAALDQSRPLEHPQVAGHGRQRNRKRLRELAHRGLAARKAGEDCTSRGIRQRGEGVVETEVPGCGHDSQAVGGSCITHYGFCI